MALVETIAGELCDQLPDSSASFLAIPFPLATFDELLSVLVNQRLFLLADRFNAGIGTGQLDPAQTVQDPHHLFLVDHHAVGFAQDLLQHRMLVFGLLTSMLDFDVVIDHAAFQRAGAVEGIGGDNVVKRSGFIFCSRSRMPPLSS